MSTAYKTVTDIAGPLMIVEGVDDISYDELCEIELTSGQKRLGKVLEAREGMAALQNALGGQTLYTTFGIPLSMIEWPVFFFLEESPEVDQETLLGCLGFIHEMESCVKDKLIVAMFDLC